jgi:hypothetical protein
VNALYALYPDPGAAQRAVNGLRAAGIAARDITVASSEPIEEYEFTRRDSRTWMHWIAAAGGVIGLLSATLLTTMTEQAWPIETGNMPIVSWWPNLIIMFELTMLGGIVAAVITLLFTAGLAMRRRGLYDPAISEGLILVGVKNPSDTSRAGIERALSAAGGAVVKRG